MKSVAEIHDMIQTTQAGDTDRILDVCLELLEHVALLEAKKLNVPKPKEEEVESKMVTKTEIKRRMKAGESVIAAYRKMDPNVIGKYLRGWELIEINQNNPDYLKVYASVPTKTEAHRRVQTQQKD